MMGKKFFLLALLAVGAVDVSGCHSGPPPAADPLTEARAKMNKDPGDVRTVVELAEIYLNTRDFLRARQYLRLAEQLAEHGLPTDVTRERLFRLGVTIAVQSQHYTDAIRRCQEYLSRTGDDVRVRHLLASLLEAIGETIAAEKQWRLLISLHPEDGHYLMELARFYERSSRPDRLQLSQKYYTRYLEVAPHGAEVAQAKAALRAQQSDEIAGQE